jgi:hypothetical protein
MWAAMCYAACVGSNLCPNGQAGSGPCFNGVCGAGFVCTNNVCCSQSGEVLCIHYCACSAQLILIHVHVTDCVQLTQ